MDPSFHPLVPEQNTDSYARSRTTLSSKDPALSFSAPSRIPLEVISTQAPHVFALSHSSVVTDYRSRHHELARQGFRVSLLVPDAWHQFNTLCHTDVIPDDDRIELIVRRPRTWGMRHHGLRNVCHIYPCIAELLTERSPDILEIWEEPYSACAWSATRAFRRINPHGIVACFSAQNVPRWLPPPFSLFRTHLFSSMNLLLAMNQDVVEVARNSGWQGPCLTLPLGVTPSTYDIPPPVGDALVKSLGLIRPVVGFLGKLTEQKGVRVLIESVANMSTTTPGSLLIIGSGELSPFVQSALPTLHRPAALQGAIHHDQIPRHLAAMDVLVVPSITRGHLKEQFGRVAVEAMAARKPVIVSDSGELPRVVGDAGIVTPEGDSAALSRALEQILGDSSLRATLGQRGRVRCEKHYAWSGIAHDMASTYRSMLD